MKTVSCKVKATILSMSLLTVMSGAAIAPALGIIKQHFADSPDILVQLIVSIPALFIIVTNLFFFAISRCLRTRPIAMVGLFLYIAAGAGCYFVESIYILLVMRALLGISVGLVMPLSTGLLAYYFPPEEQAKLMGLSAAMNQMGGVVATFLAGILASIEWNYSFLVYLFGLIALLMVFRWLPDEQLGSANKRGKAFKPSQLLKFHPSVVGMFLLMIVFFIIPTNFAIIAERQNGLGAALITLIMVALDVVAFLVGLLFGQMMNRFRMSIKYLAPIFFLVGYVFLIFDNVAMIIVGSAFIGLANGIGVPYLNTIASIKGGRNSATTVMPLLSAALYLGQFVSPIIVMLMAEGLFGVNDIVAPYKIGVVISLIFLFQVWSTRHFQSLPAERKKSE